MISNSISRQTLNTSESLGMVLASNLLPAGKRPGWKALNSLKNELSKVFNSKLDHEIRMSKLIWWHEELIRLQLNQARHPLTKKVAEESTPLLDSFNDYSDIADAWARLISGDQFEWVNRNDLSQYCKNSSGHFEVLKAQILLGKKPLHQLKEFILHANEGNIQINLLRDFGRHLRNGHLPAPLSELNSLGLISQEVLSWRQESNAGGWEKLSLNLANQAKESIQKAQQWLSPLPTNEKQSTWITQALIRIDLATLQEIENLNFKVISQRIEVTPIRTIGIALKSKLFQ